MSDFIDGPLLQRLSQTVPHRQDRPAVYPVIVPRTTALLVIDMQEAFLRPDSPACVPDASAVVESINALARELRERGATVCFTRHTVHAGDWPRYVDIVAGGNPERALGLLGAGSAGHALHERLDVQPGDLVVDKTRFGALDAAHSDLQAALVQRGIDTVVITGTLTNICCESTARQAMELDYRTIIVADATAARSDAAQWAALGNIFSAFGDVATVAGVVERCTFHRDAAAE